VSPALAEPAVREGQVLRHDRRPCGGRQTLGELLESTYSVARSGGTAECPVCGGAMVASLLDAECNDCGSHLD